MCMNQENKNKIAITGHTKGIGKAIADLYAKKNYKVKGFSRTNGYDMSADQDSMIEEIRDCDLIVLNAHAGREQLNLLKKIYSRYHDEPKKVVVITSTSGTQQGIDEDFENKNYKEYCKHKNELIGYVSDLQEELFYKKMSVYDVCPDVVDTEMTKGLWNDLPKLKPHEVAEAVSFCFESTFNVNKIVVQKNAK